MIGFVVVHSYEVFRYRQVSVPYYRFISTESQALKHHSCLLYLAILPFLALIQSSHYFL